MSTPPSRISIALIGDLHGSWSELDVHYFNQSAYDLLLMTGDLGSGTAQNGVKIARSIARIEKTTFVIAGNNDAQFGPEISAEFKYQGGLAQLLRLAPDFENRMSPADNVDVPRVTLCGYDLKPLSLRGREFTLVVARPYAMGGSELSFPHQLDARYAVTSNAESQQRLCQLMDAAPTDDLIVLAHNGPRGLGGRATDIWGCDFRPEAGDWGDSDLATALDYAIGRGKRVLAVVAGHMHRSLSGPIRTSVVRDANTLFVNPALVPRIREDATGVTRHHMELVLDGDDASVRDVFVSEE